MLIVSFSGLDGCGKSTHVSKTAQYLGSRGLRTRQLATIRISATGILLRLRGLAKRLGSSALDQKTDVAPSGAHIRVYDNNRTFVEDKKRGISVIKRWIAYPLDALALRVYLLWQGLFGVDAVVCDRYVYDKIVNLPDINSALSRIMMILSPKADLALFINTDPETVRARREEHDLTYYEAKYESYRQIVARNWGLQNLDPASIDAMQSEIESRLTEAVPGQAFTDKRENEQ